MKKIILSWLLILCMILPLALSACNETVPPANPAPSAEGSTTPTLADPPDESNDEGNTTPSSPTYPRPSNIRTYPLTEQTAGIRILGERRTKLDGCITMDWSASGVEFEVDLNTVSTVSFVAKSSNLCYFKAFVDGKVWKNGSSNYFTVDTVDTTLELKNIPHGKHLIRLVKATGYTLALAQVSSVTLDGTIKETAPAKKDLYIEFLGDSITCGWGIMGNYDGTYLSQDATLAYPYRLAQHLDADYSILGLSGKGVIHSTPNFDNNYLHVSPSRTPLETYDFARKADIVVINLGTNEEGNHASASDFEAGYVRLLNNIFEKNGNDCVVYCLWGAMNGAYNSQIQAAIAQYLETNPTAKIHTLELSRSTAPGGAPTWGHPSEGNNTQYLYALLDKINNTYFAE